MHVSHPILKGLWQGKSSSTLLVLRHNRDVPELICAHIQSICMAQCKVHSCTFAQKRRLFYLKNRPSRRYCYNRDDMLHKHTHTPASILFPSLEGSADSSILKVFTDFLYPGVPWPPTLTGHSRLPQPSFTSRDAEASDAPFSQTLTASNTCPRLGSYLADL